MKKCLKVLFLFFILFGFNSVVYASDQCIRMPGKSNNVRIPKDYSAQCQYRYNASLSSSDTKDVNYYYILNIANIGGKANLTMTDNGGTVTFNLNEDGVTVTSQDSFDFNGFQVNGGTAFETLKYENNVYECPDYMYFINNSLDESLLGFTDKLPEFVVGDTYGVFNLNNKTPSGISCDDVIFVTTNGDKDDFYNYKSEDFEVELYDNEMKVCDSVGTLEDNFDGYGDTNHFTPDENDVSIEPLITCTYYFYLDNFLNYSGNTCHTERVDFVYQKRIVRKSATEKEITLEVIATPQSFKSTIPTKNITDKLREVKWGDPMSYTNLRDYLSYNLQDRNPTWDCVDEIYMQDLIKGYVNPVTNESTLAVFGKSKYEHYVSIVGADQIAVGSKDKKEICPSKPDDSDEGDEDKDADVDWGDGLPDACDGIIGKEMLDFLNKIFRWIQILAPIFVIIMGGVDFAQAVLLDDKDAMKKASSKFIKRLIIAVALFFIPLILSWLLGIFNDITTVADTSICGIGE